MSAPSPAAARNLLFGILALQMDFIGRDALIAAMNAWVLAKEKPLGQVLLERGKLTAELHQLLDALVERHIQAHAGDAQQSLAVVSSASALKHDLQAIADPDLQASLSLVSRSPQDGEGTVSYTPPGAGPGPRFRILRPHERGGLGEVFVAEDTELRREVALKQIRADRAGDALSRGRFVLEAEITGGLEHPGIVPIYGLGSYDDGRPFYAMRFIKGDNLKEAIARSHGQPGAAPGRDGAPGTLPVAGNGRPPAASLTERNLVFRDLLGRFVDVCNAVAYAHSRGILHRDLKPGNVMLGKYGETLVVDWGLAKPVGRPESLPDTGEPTLRPASAESGTAATQAGTAVGTPAYMSPEQAAGRTDLLGPASDIYSLGATLYVVLTGRPPFAGSSAEILRQVEKGQFPPPRQVKPEVPAALEAVCLKAMALRPEQRYQTALELAADAEHWLAAEPVSAWPEPVTVKLGRWVRRNKALVSGAAAALVALIAAGAGAFWYQAERARQDQQQAKRDAEETVQQAKIVAQREFLHKEVTAALDQSETLHQQLHKQLGDPLTVHELLSDIDGWERQVQAARQAWQQAQKLADSNAELLDPVVLERLRQLDTTLGADKDDYDLARKLDDIRLEAATLVDVKWNFQAVGPKYAKVLANAGYQMEHKSVVDKIRKTPLRYVLVAALDDWATLAQDEDLRSRLLAVAREADPDDWRDRFRDAKVWNDAGALKQLAEQVDPAKQSPQILGALAQQIYLTKGQAAPLLRQALLHYPRDFWLHFGLGFVSANPDEQIGCYQAALAIRPKIAAAHNNWGCALALKKDYDGAIGHLEKALAINPNYAPAHDNWGIALAKKKDYDGAIDHFQKTLDLDPNSAHAHFYCGLALATKKDYDGAIGHFQKTLAIDPNYAEAHSSLGACLDELGNFVEALKEVQLGHALGSKQPSLALPSAQLVKIAENHVALDQKRADILAGKTRAQDVAEKIALARLCLLQKKHYATAAKFYADAFAENASLALEHRHNAACSAALAGTGQVKDAADLTAKDKAELLQQALGWLKADLAGWKQEAQSAKAAPVLKVVSMLEHSQTDSDLAGVRDAKALAQLPKEAQADWQKLWSDVDKLLKQARACFTEVETKQGTLTFTDGVKGHVVKLKAGVTYVIDLHSKQFDTLLRLENAQGKVLGQNSDVKPTEDSNAGLIFVAPPDGDYKLIATRIYPHGTGAYTLTIRTFQAKKE